MEEIKTNPDEIWSEYEKLNDYLTKNDIFNIVKKNEEFYDGRQWGDLNPSTIPKPTMNRLQRIGKYQISMLSSNDVGISMKSLMASEEENKMLSIISDEVKDIIEQGKFIESARLMIRYAFVDGASYAMQSFDTDFETGQPSKGRIENEIVDCTRMLFGNPYSDKIQKQPYIIVVLRQYVGQVQQEAKELGLGEDKIEEIKAEQDSNYDEDYDNKLCTVLIKFYRKKHTDVIEKSIVDENGNIVVEKEEKTKETIFFTKCTKNVCLIPETNLGYTRYPISRFGWDNRKNSYLFDSPITSNIVNQVFVNKMYSFAHKYAEKTGFPTKLVDVAKINAKDLEDNFEIGLANIDLLGKYLDYSKAPDFSNQIIQLIDKTESEMENNMGVNDAALGNVKPENTSAIIALQETASVPLEIQRQNFYEMWEDTVRNVIDIMVASYGSRTFFDKKTNDPVTINFDELEGLNYRLNIDIGSSAQYSEIAQINTLNSLLQNGQIDLLTFLNVCPDKFVPGKEELKKYAEDQKKIQEAMAKQQTEPTTLTADESQLPIINTQ